jgi:hypothetical protein
MDAKAYFELYAASAARYEHAANATELITQRGDPSLHTCLADIAEFENGLVGNLYVYQDGYNEVRVEDDMVREMVQLVRSMH